MTGPDPGRLLAMARKEAREFRRTPFILGAMVVLPVIFIVEPLIAGWAARPPPAPSRRSSG